jgi:hypothetical protein
MGSVVAVVVLLAAWKFASSPASSPVAQPPQHVPAAIATAREPVPEPAAPAKTVSTPSNEITPLAAGLPAETNGLNERTLVGTKWQRDGFALEFGADGKLLIGGRDRAQWRIEGSRLRLYRDDTGEEHWLDIVGDKLQWEGQEIGRVP